MSINTKRVAYTFFLYCSVIYQMLYSYFLYVADKEALEDLTDGQAELGLLIFCVVLGVCDMLESLSIVNPAEEVYARISPKKSEAKPLIMTTSEPMENTILLDSNEDNDNPKPTGYEWLTNNLCIPYPLKFLTLSAVGVGFLMTGFTNALFFGQTIKNSYIRFSVGATPLVFESVYLVMLLWEDIKEGHNYIFGKILSCKSSILLNMIRSPLISFELFLTNSLYALLASILFSYGSLQSKDAFFPNHENDNLLNQAIIGVTSFSIAYITLLSRYVSSHALYFNEAIQNENFEYSELHYKKTWAFNSILRFARSIGLSYFINKYLTVSSRNQSMILTGIAGTLLTTHGTYVSYLRCLNQAKEETLQIRQSGIQAPRQNDDPRFLMLSTVNLFSKIAYSLAIYSSFKTINEDIAWDLDKLDLIMLTLCFGIPASIIDFDYYRTKMVDTLIYHIDKTKKEIETKRFGVVGSLFRSIHEYETLPNKKTIKVIDCDTDQALTSSYGAING